MQDRITEPVFEVLSGAAVTCIDGSLRLAIGAIGRTTDAHVEMIIVSPPGAYLAEPGVVGAGLTA